MTTGNEKKIKSLEDIRGIKDGHMILAGPRDVLGVFSDREEVDRYVAKAKHDQNYSLLTIYDTDKYKPKGARK